MSKKTKKKVGLRRQARILALNILYLTTTLELDFNLTVENIFRGTSFPEEVKNFSLFLAKGSIENLSHIDTIIKSYVKNWTLDRMAAVDCNILRIGTFELLFCRETPVNVIINEAIEIAKEYSTKDSGRFINGILDQIKKLRDSNKLDKIYEKNATNFTN